MTTHVLVVEDDDLIAPPLIRTLEREGYDVTHVESGLPAIEHVEARDVDVVLLDLGLPDMDGLEVCRRIRAGGYQGAVMVLTARDGELDRVVGLDVGADDYLSKPFSLSELLARIRAVLRRGWAAPRAAAPKTAAPAATTPPAAPSAATPPPTAASGTEGPDLLVDVRARRVTIAGQEVAVTAKEFDVLALLDSERGAVVTRERLMDEVWDENWFGSTKTLDATVGRLRHKLEEGGSPVWVATVRGVGFRLEDGPPDA